MATHTVVKLSETDLSRVATETADSFIDNFYNALHNSRKSIASFYAPVVKNEDTKRSLPFICWNGELHQDGAEFQTEFDKMPYFFAEVQSLDAHVLNPCLDPEAGKTQKEAERNVSISAQVSGYVRLIERKDGPLRGFSDHIVLVPNKDTSKAGEGRQWVIQTQNFRFVV